MVNCSKFFAAMQMLKCSNKKQFGLLIVDLLAKSLLNIVIIQNYCGCHSIEEIEIRVYVSHSNDGYYCLTQRVRTPL